MALGSVALAVVLWLSLRGETGLRVTAVLGPGVLLALPLGVAGVALAPLASSLGLLVAALAALGGAWAAAAGWWERDALRAGLAAWRARRVAAGAHP
jgi:hypothetical protein